MWDSAKSLMEWCVWGKKKKKKICLQISPDMLQFNQHQPRWAPICGVRQREKLHNQRGSGSSVILVSLSVFQIPVVNSDLEINWAELPASRPRTGLEITFWLWKATRNGNIAVYAQSAWLPPGLLWWGLKSIHLHILWYQTLLPQQF